MELLKKKKGYLEFQAGPREVRMVSRLVGLNRGLDSLVIWNTGNAGFDGDKDGVGCGWWTCSCHGVKLPDDVDVLVGLSAHILTNREL